jgi:hypothetical protein
MKRKWRILLSVFCSTAFLSTLAGVNAAVAMPTGGDAGAEPQGMCDSSNWDVGITNVSRVYVPGTFRVGGSPGALITIAVGFDTTVTGTISAEATVEAGVIFAKASTTVGMSLALSRTMTNSASVSATAPADATAPYIELGAEGRSFSYVATRYNSNCVVIEQKSGPATGATTTLYGYLSWVGFV